MVNVAITTEFITLGKLLKLLSFIGSGGEAKMYLLMNDVFVNNDPETRRGRKIYPDDVVTIETQEYRITKHETG